MPDAENGQDTNTPIKTPSKDRRWARFVSNVKSEFHERTAKKQKESTSDRSARLTANATVGLMVFTVILAATSVGTVWILKNQLREMHEGGIDTHALADATEKMKGSAEKSAQASRDFADTATKINGGIADAVKKLDAQAGVARRAIEESSKSSIEDRRPWVGIQGVVCANCTGSLSEAKILLGRRPSQPQTFSVGNLSGTTVNSGKTPALRVHIEFLTKTLGFQEPIPTWDTLNRQYEDTLKIALAGLPPELHVEKVGVSQLGDYQKTILAHMAMSPNSPISVNLLNDRKWEREYVTPNREVIYVVGKISYFDASARSAPFVTTFCVMNSSWYPGQSFTYCPAGNDMN